MASLKTIGFIATLALGVAGLNACSGGGTNSRGTTKTDNQYNTGMSADSIIKKYGYSSIDSLDEYSCIDNLDTLEFPTKENMAKYKRIDSLANGLYHKATIDGDELYHNVQKNYQQKYHNLEEIFSKEYRKNDSICSAQYRQIRDKYDPEIDKALQAGDANRIQGLTNARDKALDVIISNKVKTQDNLISQKIAAQDKIITEKIKAEDVAITQKLRNQDAAADYGIKLLNSARKALNVRVKQYQPKDDKETKQ